MNSRAHRLTVVLDMAARAEQQAARAFELARQQWQGEVEKLRNLESYCAEYETTMSGARVARRAQDIARDRGFLQQIYRARQQQELLVNQRETLVEHNKRLWHKAHLKHGALRNLIQRMRDDEQKALNRNEEKLLDEWFAQITRHRREAESL